MLHATQSKDFAQGKIKRLAGFAFNSKLRFLISNGNIALILNETLPIVCYQQHIFFFNGDLTLHILCYLLFGTEEEITK